MKIRHAGAVALLFASAAASSETLVSGGLICETAEPLAVVRADSSLRGQPGAKIMAIAAEQAKFYGIVAEAHGTIGNAYANDPSARIRYGETAQAQAQASAAKSKAAPYALIVDQCMAYGPEASAVKVLERRPISGTAHIGMSLQGNNADVWTADYMLTP